MIWFVLADPVMHRLYVDRSRYSYAFNQMEQAVLASRNPTLEGCRVQPFHGSRTDLLSAARLAGADSMLIDTDGQPEDVQITCRMIHPTYYNARLSRTLGYLRRERRKRDLLNLAHCVFLIPARVSQEEGFMIRYAAAEQPGKEVRYFAFPDLDRFSDWSHENPGWNALEIPFSALHRIGSKHGFLIDPDGPGLILPPDILD